MDRRNQDMLTNRLEEASLDGCSHVTWNELYRWYDVKKIAARTYRDLEARWQELTAGALGRLMTIPGRGGVFLFGEKSAKPIDRKSVV